MIDAHCHYSFLSYKQVENALLQQKKIGIEGWILAGYDFEDWAKQLELKKNFHDEFMLSFGLHPWSLKEKEDYKTQLSYLEMHSHKYDFLGEMGLDFKNRPSPELKALQRSIFEAQLNIAKKINKPIVVHSVSAVQETLDILSTLSPVRGFVHGFSGPPEVAIKYIDLGLKLSIGRSVLNSNSRKLFKTLKNIDYRHFVFETDLPSYQDRIIPDASTLLGILEKVGLISGVSVDDLKASGSENILAMLR